MESIKPIQKKRIYEEVAEQIKRLIRSGKLGLGEKLPSERELAARFGVSRASVRQALTVLEMAGIIVRKQGEGTYNQDIHSFRVTHMGEAILAIKRESIRQSIESRKLIEPAVAGLAAIRATPENKKMLAENFARQEKLVRESIPITEEDNNFHLAIAKAANNDILFTAVEAILILSQNNKSRGLANSAKIALNGHKKVLDAIFAGDPERAQKAMAEHLDDVECLVRKSLEEFPG